MLPLDFKGMDLVRGRDCTVFVKGDTHAFAVSPSMLAGGWVGGQGFQWGQSTNDAPIMTYSTGLYGGVLVWGNDEQGDRFTAMTGQFLKYGYAVAMVGNALISTVAYEQYTYASRIGGGALAPLVYVSGEPLFFSRRGYWTKEDEMTLTGDALAPAFFAGFVAQIPKPLNQMRLGVQTSM
jgi:hypothetical protein